MTTLRLLGLSTFLATLLGLPAQSAPVPAAERIETSEKTQEVNFDDLKFEMKKEDPFERTMLTSKIEDLNGKPIRVRGYMLPSFQAKGIKQFVLVRDNLECCFGPGAALYDCIMVDMVDGESAKFSVRPIAVEGIFKVQELKGVDGKHLAIYHLDGWKVK